MRWRLVAATAALSTALAVSMAGATASVATSWESVATVWDGSFTELSMVTDTHGMVVAAWAGRADHDLYVAVRKAHGPWSTPTRIITDTPIVRLATGGAGAWVMWVDTDHVTVAHIAKNGRLGTSSRVGLADESISHDAKIAVGANGAVAVAWHELEDLGTGLLALNPHDGGGWREPEGLEWGTIAGLSVDADGYIDVIAAKDNPDLGHQRITYHRGFPLGGFGGGVVLAESAYLTTAAGNPNGGFMVGWEQDNGDGTYSAVGRYRPDGGPFGSARQLHDNVPFGTRVAMAVSDDGYAVALYRVAASGAQQFRLSPVTPSGQWLTAMTVPLSGFSYGVAISPDGNALATSRPSSGVQLVTCPEQVGWGGADTNPAPDGFPLASVRDSGVVNLLWGRGCLTRACYPTSLVAQRST